MSLSLCNDFNVDPGRPVLYSVGDVTEVVHDCDIPAVIEKRVHLLST